MSKGVNTRSRLLCPECSEMKKVQEVLGDDASPSLAVLECGHVRPAGTLPLKPGRVSLEHMRTSLGRDAFRIISGALVTA
jgi:uncharacterized Zn finger protein